jgi:chromosome segregation ATPase
VYITLDLRWNSAGLIGGRAFVDILKWNTTLIEIDLAGNELPDEIAVALGTALERNKDRFKHELFTAAHTEQLTTTLQTLESSHQDAISKLSQKLNNVDTHALSLSTKLALASTEIEESQTAFRALEAKYERLIRDRSEIEDTLVRERKENGGRINDLQKELALERQVGNPWY